MGYISIHIRCECVCAHVSCFDCLFQISILDGRIAFCRELFLCTIELPHTVFVLCIIYSLRGTVETIPSNRLCPIWMIKLSIKILNTIASSWFDSNSRTLVKLKNISYYLNEMLLCFPSTILS